MTGSRRLVEDANGGGQNIYLKVFLTRLMFVNPNISLTRLTLVKPNLFIRSRGRTW